MHGFKSFADPVEINFTGAVTGIIGPNGCGKSNVVDAVRFVLGEQSLRLLRARKIDDLIFAGNIRRPATSIGEVALTLDNSKRWIDIDYPEVEIRRMIQRDGESKYFLNGTLVRLKDIQKMFMDVGVNKGHYSVIGQNQVQLIVAASPEERRLYFEEAAGVVSYRQSKKETMRRLEEVQKNLDQAGVFTAEYESRMHGLKVQVGRAQKYLEYQTAYRRLYLFSAWRRWHQIRDEMESIGRQAASLTVELETLQTESGAFTAREAALAEERQRMSASMAELESALQAAEFSRGEKDKLLAAADEKLYNLRRSLNEIDIAQSRLQRSLSELLSADGAPAADWAGQFESAKRRIGVSFDQAEANCERIRAELASTEKRLRAEEDRIDKSRDDIISAHEEAAAIESKLAAFTAAAEESRVRMEQIAAQTASAEARIAALKSDQSARSDRRTQSGEAQTSAELAVKEAEQRMEESRERLNRLRREMAEAEGRFRSISAAEDAYQGFSTSVRMVLERFNKHDEFLGAVRDLMTFDAPYAKAVEAALGPKLQHLVVERGDTVKDILKEITGGLRGRVTFWALDLLPPPVAAPTLAPIQNSIGWAVSLLKFDEKLRRLFENLLGRTIVVEHMEALLAAARVVHGAAIVTLDGAYYRAGAITAGPTAGALLLGRKRELSDAERRVKELADRIASEEDAFQRACSGMAACRSAAGAAFERYKEADGEHLRVSAALESLAGVLQEKKRLLEIESNQFSLKMGAVSECRARHAEIQESGGLAVASDRQILDDLRGQTQTLRAESDSAAESLREVHDRDRDLRRIESEHTELSTRRSGLAAEIESAQARIEQLRQELAAAEQESAARKHALAARQAELTAVTAESEAARARSAEIIQASQKYRDDLHGFELRLTALGAERQNLRENVMNELQTDIETQEVEPPAPEGIDLSAPQSWVDQLKELLGKMQKLGAVNVNAIDEFNEVSGKHTDLTRQIEDLTQARENLKDALRKTDRICRERFADVFQRVAGYFQEVTKKLFLGGEGKLILTQSEDMMESGVDIQLRPPGKGFTSLASRSGGEQALAGLCLLFALFMEKPSPFCFLDEVDAALDDVNVGRLIRLIEEFSNRIQFVIVTHNKISMQASGSLFGATMEEAGITKLISVRMKQAQESVLAAAS